MKKVKIKSTKKINESIYWDMRGMIQTVKEDYPSISNEDANKLGLYMYGLHNKIRELNLEINNKNHRISELRKQPK